MHDFEFNLNTECVDIIQRVNIYVIWLFTNTKRTAGGDSDMKRAYNTLYVRKYWGTMQEEKGRE